MEEIKSGGGGLSQSTGFVIAPLSYDGRLLHFHEKIKASKQIDRIVLCGLRGGIMAKGQGGI